MLAVVSTQHKILLGGMAAIFIAFALSSSLVFPRRNAGFPGRNRNLFLLITSILFVAMLLAVEFFAVEEEEEHGGEPEALVVQRL
jgi:hypothetical protein